jgi:hypothetical protein
MDFNSIPEDLSQCNHAYWRKKAEAGVLPSSGGSCHEAKLVGVRHYYAWIDEGLAPLIHNAWDCGLDTESACHNLYDMEPGNETCLITFDSVYDCKAFIEGAFFRSETMEGIWTPDTYEGEWSDGPESLDLYIQHNFGFQVSTSPRLREGREWDLLGDSAYIQFERELAPMMNQGMIDFSDEWYFRESDGMSPSQRAQRPHRWDHVYRALEESEDE